MFSFCLSPRIRNDQSFSLIQDEQNNFAQNQKKKMSLYKQLPLQIKIANFLGVKNILINHFVFAKRESNYRLNTHSKSAIFQFQRIKLNKIDGYYQTCQVIDEENYFIPIVRFQLNKKVKIKESIDSKLVKHQDLTIIYSHGNSSNLQDSYQFITSLTKKIKLNFIIYDYTGYANNTTQSKKFASQRHVPSEQSISKDLSRVIKWSGLSEKNIILWGFSLGCFPTIKVSTQLNVNGLILQSPFASLYRFVNNELTIYQRFQGDCFQNIELIDKIKSNMLIIHSHNDQVTPIRHARMLMQKFQQKRNSKYFRMLQVKKFSHNNLNQAFYSQKSNRLQQNIQKYIWKCKQQLQLQLIKISKNVYSSCKNIQLELVNHDKSRYINEEEQNFKQNQKIVLSSKNKKKLKVSILFDSKKQIKQIKQIRNSQIQEDKNSQSFSTAHSIQLPKDLITSNKSIYYHFDNYEL